MTNEEAISLLNNITSYCDFEDEYGDMIDSEPYYEAVELAIKALEQQNKSEIPTSSDTCDGCRYELNSTNGNPCYSCGKYKLTEQEPCEDAISREAVNKAINKWLSSPYYDYKNYIYEMTKTIHELPSVKPQRAKGHWSNKCECSVCGNQPWYYGSTFRKDYKFCPYCGAEMESEDEG